MGFFFQAEDGIRDAQESRGLGDVYKRQVHIPLPGRSLQILLAPIHLALLRRRRRLLALVKPVSYTHLTLPTIYSV